LACSDKLSSFQIGLSSALACIAKFNSVAPSLHFSAPLAFLSALLGPSAFACAFFFFRDTSSSGTDAGLGTSASEVEGWLATSFA